MKRFLICALVLPAALAAGILFGCATSNTQLQSDADLIALAVQSLAPVALAKATPADAVTINQAVAAITDADKAIGGFFSSGGSVSTVQGLVAGVEKLAPVALRYLDPNSQYALEVAAAEALLPAVLKAAGLTPAPTAGPAPVAMTEAQARAVLRGAK